MPAPADDRRRLLLVAGTGRSGTSTAVGVLARHGFHVPLPEVAADDTNPRGYGEPQWVVDLHGRRLRRARVQVADSRPAAWQLAARVVDQQTRDRVRAWLEEHFLQSPRLVVKDPRLLWFLPAWTELGESLGAEVGYVTMLRPPPETVGSRRTYYNRRLEDPHGTAGWINLMLGTERATRGRPRAFVRYHDLLDDWAPVVAHIWRRTGIDGGEPPAPSEDPGEFIDRGLHRMRLDWSDLDLPERLERLAQASWECLDVLATPEAQADDPEVLDRLDELRREYAAYYAESESVAHSSVIAARQSARSSRHSESSVPGGELLGMVRGRGAGRLSRAAAADGDHGGLRRRLGAVWRGRARLPGRH